jgi:hypothetical protein
MRDRVAATFVKCVEQQHPLVSTPIGLNPRQPGCRAGVGLRGSSKMSFWGTILFELRSKR